ncbi:MAG: hypothetical protein RLZ06_608 [Actinomycetota bacterium]
MSDEFCGCEEFEAIERGFSRRGFIGSVLALGGGLLVTDASGLQYATAAVGDANADVIISVSMRGGMDGIMAVQPLGESRLRTLRPNLSLNDSQTLALDNHFGLHPNLKNFKSWFDSGQLAVVHAVGTPVGTRSHFDDQKSLELAAYSNPAMTQGWQNRFLQATGATDVFAGFAPQNQTPISMMGKSGTAVFNNINDVLLEDIYDVKRADYINILQKMHSKSSHPWQKSALDSLTASERLRSVKQQSDVQYPNTGFGNRMRVLAQLLKSGIAIKTANVDFDGNLDVHSNAGLLDGQMAENFKSLNNSLEAFRRDIGDIWNRTTIVTLTEFGRRLEENASQGIDHGWASAMFVMGGGVKGGKVIADWPGLSQTALRDGDLQVTLDYRHVLSEVLRYRGGIATADLANILPGFKSQDLGLVRQLGS